MIGVLLQKVATETGTLSVMEAKFLNHVCSICRNVLVKVQKAQKHLEDTHKEYCTRLKLAQRATLQPVMNSPEAHDTGILQQPIPLPPATVVQPQALAPSKHARPLFSPSGISPAPKRPSLHQKATPDTQPSHFSHSRVSPAAKRPTLHPLRVTPNVPSPQRNRSTLGLRDSGDRPTAARSLTFSGASSVVQVREIRVYTDLDDDTDEDIKV